MKKSKLIAMLNAMPGDPDIKLWNGMVGDWMEIDPKLVEQVLVKQTLSHWLEMCRMEECRDRSDWTYQMPAEEVEQLTKRYSKLHQWEMNEYVTQDEINKGWFTTKTVQIMQPKKRGVKTWDRQGTMEY